MRTDNGLDTGAGGFRIAAGLLEDVAVTTRAVADSMRTLDVAHLVRQAAAALPGSATAHAAPGVIGTWMAHGLAIADDLTAHAAAYAAAADTYYRVDAAVLDMLTHTIGPGRS